jgi:hypothetical protein
MSSHHFVIRVPDDAKVRGLSSVPIFIAGNIFTSRSVEINGEQRIIIIVKSDDDMQLLQLHGCTPMPYDEILSPRQKKRRATVVQSTSDLSTISSTGSVVDQDNSFESDFQVQLEPYFQTRNDSGDIAFDSTSEEAPGPFTLSKHTAAEHCHLVDNHSKASDSTNQADPPIPSTFESILHRDANAT